MSRDSEETRQKILKAFGRLLAEQGFENAGINAVARAAGVDKVLIYRYFGGMPQLLRAFASGGFWPATDELLGRPAAEAAHMEAPELARTLLKGHLRELRLRPVTQEIMRWEMIRKNELTGELAEAREKAGLELLGLEPFGSLTASDRDLAAVGALIHAGLTYLVLRAKTADLYMGLDLRRDEDWERLEKAVDELLDAYFGQSRAFGAAGGE